jgi:hypothetical protein
MAVEVVFVTGPTPLVAVLTLALLVTFGVILTCSQCLKSGRQKKVIEEHIGTTTSAVYRRPASTDAQRHTSTSSPPTSIHGTDTVLNVDGIFCPDDLQLVTLVVNGSRVTQVGGREGQDRVGSDDVTDRKRDAVLDNAVSAAT